MDAYYAPYEKHSRYWTGFLLLIRCTLFLVFALNTSHNAYTNFLVITLVCAGLATLARMHKLYTKWHNNFLEAFSILNLCVVAAGTYHIKITGGKQAILVYTPVGMTFVTYIFLMVYHAYSRMQEYFKFPEVSNLPSQCFKKLIDMKVTTKFEDTIREGTNTVSKSHTTTTIELSLQEPLLYQ